MTVGRKFSTTTSHQSISRLATFSASGWPISKVIERLLLLKLLKYPLALGSVG